MGAIKKIAITCIILMAIAICFFVTSFGSALFQEGNPIPLLYSAMKLQLSDHNYQQFSKTDTRIRYLSEITGNSDYQVVKDFMQSKGWKYQEQMGSGLIFSKNGEDAIVVVRQYSSNFFIWEIQKRFSENDSVTYHF